MQYFRREPRTCSGTGFEVYSPHSLGNAIDWKPRRRNLHNLHIHLPTHWGTRSIGNQGKKTHNRGVKTPPHSLGNAIDWKPIRGLTSTGASLTALLPTRWGTRLPTARLRLTIGNVWSEELGEALLDFTTIDDLYAWIDRTQESQQFSAGSVKSF